MNCLTERKLWPHQVKIFEHILDVPYCGVWAGMGSGKTAATLFALKAMREEFMAFRVLVVSTLRVVTSTWPEEIHEWPQLDGLTYEVYTGELSKSERARILSGKQFLTFVNKENFPALVRHFGEENWPYDVVVFDDAPLRRKNTNRYKALLKVRRKLSALIQLTGTPSPRSLEDIWAQVYIMDAGKRLGRTKTQFMMEYFNRGRSIYVWEPRKGAAEEISNKIADLVISLTEEDYAKLPPRIDQFIKVPVPDKRMKEYRKFKRNLVLELLEAGQEITAANAAVLALKLLQWCSGAIYDENRTVHKIHDEKLKVLKELIEDNPDENFLVAYTFKHEINRIKEYIPFAEVLDSDPNTIKRWNNKEIRVLLAHPKSAGHGLNLQHGGRNCVWFSLTYDLELYLQYNKRLHRGSQKQPVNIFHLVIPGTQEETVVDVLRRKGDLQQYLMDAVKVMIKDEENEYERGVQGL